MGLFILSFAVIVFNIYVFDAEIVYFDTKSSSVIKDENTAKNTEDTYGAHLPLSALFKQSSKYNCIKNNGECQSDGQDHEPKVYFGPRHQKIHLALPRTEMKEVGHTEKVTFNNREMNITTLSMTPYIVEISNFLSINETELIIDLGKAKGMKPRDAKPNHVYLPDQISQTTFDLWDQDFDGHLSFDEGGCLAALSGVKYWYRDKHNFIERSQNLGTLQVEILVGRIGGLPWWKSQTMTHTIRETKLDVDNNDFISYGELAKGGMQNMKTYLQERAVERAYTKSHNVREAWLWHDDDELLMYEELLEDYHQRIENVTGVPTALIEQSEPLKVVKHEEGSFSSCQHDSKPSNGQPCCVYGGESCRMCRYATILMFLNDVESGGEIVFPLADNKTFAWEDLKEDTLRKCEKTPNAKTSNLVITPKQGSAILFFNHVVSPRTGWMSEMVPQSLYGTTTVKTGERWIAKMWVDVIGDGINDLRPWKMGTNWLSENNRNIKIIESLRNDYFIEGENYEHIHRSSYRRDQTKDEEKIAIHPKTIVESNEIAQIVSSTESVYANKATILADQRTLKEIKNNENKVDKIDDNKIINNSMNFDKKIGNNAKVNKPAKNPVTSSTQDIFKQTITPLKPLKQKSNTTHDELKTNPSTTEKFPKRQKVPLGPPKRPLDPKPFMGGKLIENRLVKASLLLLDELERDELEIIARSLHEKLQLACIPLIVNPIG